jgi:hypothetical protein
VASRVFAYLAERSRLLAERETSVLQGMVAAGPAAELGSQDVWAERQGRAERALLHPEPGGNVGGAAGRAASSIQQQVARQQQPQPQHGWQRQRGRQQQQRPDPRAYSAAPLPVPGGPMRGPLFQAWRGQLVVESHKGAEAICALSTSHWPSMCPMPASGALMVQRYVAKADMSQALGRATGAVQLCTDRNGAAALEVRTWLPPRPALPRSLTFIDALEVEGAPSFPHKCRFHFNATAGVGSVPGGLPCRGARDVC